MLPSLWDLRRQYDWRTDWITCRLVDVNSASPPLTENLLITSRQMEKIRLLSVVVYHCVWCPFLNPFIGGGSTTIRDAGARPVDLCSAVQAHICWLPVSNSDISSVWSSGWRLPFSPTLLHSAVCLPTCWAHTNPPSTSRLQTRRTRGECWRFPQYVHTN